MISISNLTLALQNDAKIPLRYACPLQQKTGTLIISLLLRTGSYHDNPTFGLIKSISPLQILPTGPNKTSAYPRKPHTQLSPQPRTGMTTSLKKGSRQLGSLLIPTTLLHVTVSAVNYVQVFPSIIANILVSMMMMMSTKPGTMRLISTTLPLNPQNRLRQPSIDVCLHSTQTAWCHLFHHHNLTIAQMTMTMRNSVE